MMLNKLLTFLCGDEGAVAMHCCQERRRNDYSSDINIFHIDWSAQFSEEIKYRFFKIRNLDLRCLFFSFAENFRE